MNYIVLYDSTGESSSDEEGDYEEREKESFTKQVKSKTQRKNSKTKINGKVSTTTDEQDNIDYDKYNSIQGEGLIKTRAQRQAELSKEREYEKTQDVNPTFDVNSVWESMKNKSLAVPSSRKNSDSIATSQNSDSQSESSNYTTSQKPSNISEPQTTSLSGFKDEYIIIKKVYSFAGKVSIEEQRVLKSSAEGLAYLKEQESTDKSANVASSNSSSGSVIDKPIINKTTSSVPQKRRGPVKRKQGSLMDELNSLKPKKLNTLEKSKMDWLGYINKEGIKDELVLHNKNGYLQKQDFLSRVDTRLEQDIKLNTRRK